MFVQADVVIRRKKRVNGETIYESVVAKGHLDEVSQLRKGGTRLGGEKYF